MLKKTMIVILPMIFNACASFRAPSLNMLEKRADLSGTRDVEEALKSVDNPFLVPNRTKPIITDIWIHPYEMPTGDYFRGGWIRTIVSGSKWEVGENDGPIKVYDDEGAK